MKKKVKIMYKSNAILLSKVQKNTESINPIISKTKNDGTMMLSKCAIFIGALSGLRQFLATESPLKMMKNVFYFISKALFVLKIFEFLS